MPSLQIPSLCPGALLHVVDGGLGGRIRPEAAVMQVASGPVSFNFSEVSTTPSDTLQCFKKGRMQVAVAEGSKPWTASEAGTPA